MKMRFYYVMLLVVLSVVALGAGTGQAFNVEQMAVHARALGLANTCTADPPRIMAIHYNPAGLTSLKGTQIDVGITYADVEVTSRFKKGSNYVNPASPYTGNDPVADTEGTSHKGVLSAPFVEWITPIIAPNLGISHQPTGSRWPFAYGMYAPIGIGIEHTGDDAAKYGGQRVMEDRFIYAAPTVAYKVTDSLSLGVSLGLGYTSIGATFDMRAPNHTTGGLAALGVITSPYNGLGKLDMLVEDNMTLSCNVGMLWQPVEWFSFGAVYQSEAKTKNMEGDFKMTYSQSFKNLWNTAQALGYVTGAAKDGESGKISVEDTIPRRAQIGIMVKPFKSLKLLCDWHWIDYRCKERDIFEADQDLQVLQLASSGLFNYEGGSRKLIIERHWQQKYNFSYAIEWQATKSLCLRAGFEPRKTVIPDEYYELTYPVTDWDIYTVGMGVNLSDQLTVDLALAYVYNNDHSIPKNTSKVLNSPADGAAIIYNPYSGLDYEQKTEAILASINISYKW
jgi:long-subunit fatty acid transport protein